LGERQNRHAQALHAPAAQHATRLHGEIGGDERDRGLKRIRVVSCFVALVAAGLVAAAVVSALGALTACGSACGSRLGSRRLGSRRLPSQPAVPCLRS
jgi:hypothetical protein